MAATPGLEHLPVEVSKYQGVMLTQIASMVANLLDDGDMVRLSLTSKRLYARVLKASSSPFWRSRFLDAFELPNANTPTKVLAELYRRRRKYIRRSTKFRFGTSRPETILLHLARDLAIESYEGGVAADGQISRNFQSLKIMALNSGIMDNVLQPSLIGKQNELLVAVQLLLYPFAFQAPLSQVSHGFGDSQLAMYESDAVSPIFTGTNKSTVNLVWALKCVEFWKHHFFDEQSELVADYQELPPPQTVGRPWKTSLAAGPGKIGKRWFSMYSYLDQTDFRRLRNRTNDDLTEIYSDMFCDPENDERFQTLELDASPRAAMDKWPATFERHLNSLKYAQGNANGSSRAPQRSTRSATSGSRPSPPGAAADQLADEHLAPLRFRGCGCDNEKFFASGWIQELPPQQGISGWKRFTMMKFYVTEEQENVKTADPFAMRGSSGQPADPFDHIEPEGLWAYEGLVLPGGQVIVGKWWPAGDEAQDEASSAYYSGPFIMWAVDDE